MNLITMNDLNLQGKRVLIREDLNVPIKDGLITSDRRLQAAIPHSERSPGCRSKCAGSFPSGKAGRRAV